MLEIAFRKNKTIGILDLSGNIDIDASIFIEKIGWCLENGYEDILCNFGNVNIVDYAGLSVLAIALKNIVNHKGRVKFLNVPDHIKKVFSLMCLDKVFEIYDSETHAVNSFKEDKIIEEIQKKQLRRRFKRLPIDIVVHFKSVGMLIFANKSCPLGEVLEVKLSLLPKPGVVDLKARVVWLVQKELQPEMYPAMGLEFYQLDSHTQKQIVDFVNRNLPSGCIQ